MDDYIRREDAINAVLGLTMYKGSVPVDSVLFNINEVKSADVRPAMEWVSVKDRLPEIGKPVLGAVYTTDIVFCKDGETIEQAVKRTMEESVKHPYVTICFYEEDGWNGADGFPMICSPKFWTELPEPPKVNDWRDL